jgi:hypothetical protein
VQISDLKADVVAEIRQYMDPYATLFSGCASAAQVENASKKRPVRHLDKISQISGLLPLVLVLDNKHQQLWQQADMRSVLHVERYSFFPRPSLVWSLPSWFFMSRRVMRAWQTTVTHPALFAHRAG